MDRILGIIVLYNPNKDVLINCILSLINQINFLWVSDNTPVDSNIEELLYSIIPKDRFFYKKYSRNVGIATAQNSGLFYAQQKEFTHVLFFDQDSIAPAGMVSTLVARLRLLKERGDKVGGIGPMPINIDTGLPYIKNARKYYLNDICEVSELMNSASLFYTKVFDDVGLMDESLFIDGVDHEFCWRASSNAQYHFFMVTSLFLNHKLGEGDQHFMGKSVKIPTPFRTYYQFRNYFWLTRRKYVPTCWKISNGIKYLLKYIYYPIFCKPRANYFKNINKGIIDGIKGQKNNKL